MVRKILGEDELRAAVRAQLATGYSHEDIVEIIVDGVLELHKRDIEIEQLKKRLKRRK